jgi:predicted hotdog family 3-hydroxylacyl-ACP dehydratase
MCLLDRIEAHDDAATRCRALPKASELFRRADGSVPTWVGIEYMAQCVAAHGGLLARARGEAPRPGLFVGSRRLVFRCQAFAPDVPLLVSARHAAGRGDNLAFDCAVSSMAGGEPFVAGRLNVHLLRELPGAAGAPS